MPPEDPQNTTPPVNPLTFGRSIGSAKEATYKELGAQYIAKIIVWTFTGAVAALILLVYLVVLLHPGIENTSCIAGSAEKCTPVYRAVELLTLAAAPALKEFGAFISTVFGSLLAFVLGYYFGEQKKSAQNQ
ncbi:MAG: hypothetical protein ACLP7O_12615 [Terracidiphilus sp.]